MKEIDTYEENVTSYLQSLQNLKNEEGEEDTETEFDDVILEIMDIVREIVNNVETTIALKQVHQKVSSQRTQKPFFDLTTLVPDFQLNDKVFQNMIFRENLVISKLNKKDPLPHMVKFDEDLYDTDPVGGLCLDIQSAEGNNLKNMFTATDEEMNKEISDKIDDIREVLYNDDDPVSVDKYESYLKSEVETYEKELKEKMKCSNDKFLVHLSSQFVYNERNAGSRITAWVDKRLHTLEELRTEFVYDGDHGLIEKTLYTVLEKDDYMSKYKYPAEKILNVRKHSFEKTRDLILEGSNFILMRFLALAKFVGTFELSTFYIDGSLCRNIYECCGPCTGIFNDTRLDICKIYRTIIEKCEITHKCCTILTTQGQILKQDWEGCEFVLHVNPMYVLRNRKPTGDEEIITKKIWEHDMQLLSKYLDVKTETSLLIKAYMRDHPEVMDIISDYVQHILQMKPDKVIEFTIDYFQSYLPLNLPKISLIESEESFFRL